MRQGGVGLRGVRKTSTSSSSSESSSSSGSTSTSSSSSSSVSSSSDSEQEAKVQISTSLFSKQPSVSPPKSSKPDSNESSRQKENRLGLGHSYLQNSDVKTSKVCDINISDSKIVKEVNYTVKNSEEMESNRSVPERSATNHDRFKTSTSTSIKDSTVHSKIEGFKNKKVKMTSLNTVTPVFSNLYKSSSSDSFSEFTFPTASKPPSLPSPRVSSPTKSPGGSSGRTSSKPGGTMSSLISNLSNRYLSKSPLSSNSFSMNRNEKITQSQNLFTETKEKPWGFAAAAAQRKPEIIGLDKSGSTVDNSSKTKHLVPPLLNLNAKSSLSNSLSTPLGPALNSPLGSTLTAPLGSPLPKLPGSSIKPSVSSSLCSLAQDSSNKIGNHRPGIGQLKGLYDGLSHYFTTPTHSRFRTGANTPNYNPGRRKPRSEIPKRKHKPLVNNTKPMKKVPPTAGPFPSPEEVRKPPPSSPSFVPQPARSTRTDYLSPSYLVKAAVNAKKHETERRRFFNEEGPHIVSDSILRFHEKQALKRELIAEATSGYGHHQTHHPVPPIPPQTVRRTDRAGKKLPVPPPPFCLPNLAPRLWWNHSNCSLVLPFYF